MRIWLRIPSERFRRALSALLAEAGHEVSTAPEPRSPVDLLVLLDPSLPVPLEGTAVLHLRPGPGRAADPNPVEALARAVRSRGRATWGSPFAPAALLEALASPDVRPRRAAEVPVEVPVALAKDPWLLVDPGSRDLAWVNPAAQARFPGAAKGAAVEELEEPLRGAVAVALSSPEGRRTLDVGGRRCLVVWWPDLTGRRTVGILDLPRGEGDRSSNLETLAEIGRMSATLVHEIRNPLAALAGALDLLRRGSSPEDAEEILDLARQRLDQMKALLDDTLRLSRSFKGPPARLDLVPVLESALTGVRPDPLFEHVRLGLEAAEASLDVLGYEEPLRQAVVNLLLNAGQAQDGHGSVTLSLAREGDVAVVRVRDEGPGIPPERRERVFEPFWTTKKTGTGLGLSYVRHVAQACGGRAFVEETPVGACLRIEVPLAG